MPDAEIKRDTRDHIVSTRWLLDHAKAFLEEVNIVVYILQKSLAVWKMHDILKEMGVPQHLIVLMHKLYSEQKLELRQICENLRPVFLT